MRGERKSEEEIAREKMRQAVLCAFCSIMQTTRLRPMMVLRLAAQAVGAIYKEVATVHRHADTCPCGWEPRADADVEALQIAIATAAAVQPVSDLRWLKIAGRA